MTTLTLTTRLERTGPQDSVLKPIFVLSGVFQRTTPHGGKGPALEAELHRAAQMDGPYTKILTAKVITMEPNGDGQRLSASLTDPEPQSTTVNTIWYKVRLLCEKSEVAAGPPIEIPLVPLPTFSSSNFSWAPIHPQSTATNVTMEYRLDSGDAGTVLKRVFCGDKEPFRAVHAFMGYPFRGKLEIVYFMPPALDLVAVRSIESSSGYRERRTCEVDLPVGVAPVGKAASDVGAGYIIPTAILGNDCGLLVRYNNERLTSTKFWNDGQPQTSWPRLPYDEREGRSRSVPAIMEFTAKDNTVEQLTIPVPPSIRSLSASSLPEGVRLVWDSSDVLENRSILYPANPMISVWRSHSIQNGTRSRETFTFLTTLPLTTSSFLDETAEPGKACSYWVGIEHAHVKAKAWFEGLGLVPVFVPLEGHMSVKNYNQMITAQRPIIQDVPQPTQEAVQKRVAQDFSQPIRIGLLKGELYHEGTGVLASRLLHGLASSLLAREDVILYDRLNADAMVEELVLATPEQERQKVRRMPIDFAIRLRDYSHERSNGVEIWLTQMEPRVNVPDVSLKQSYRLFQVDLADNKVPSPEEIRKRVLAKVQELNGRGQAEDVSDKAQWRAPKCAVLSTLTPCSQEATVWQFEALTEKLLLQLSGNVGDISFLSREDWHLAVKERGIRAMREGKRGGEIPGDFVLTGWVWNNKQGPLSYLLVADELKTGRLLGCLETSEADLRTAVPPWLSALRLPPPMPAGAKAAADDKLLEVEKRLSPLGQRIPESRNAAMAFRLQPWLREEKSLDDLDDAALKMAGEFWDKGQRSKAIEFLTDKWEESESARIGDRLAGYYHDSGAFASEASILTGLLSNQDMYASTLQRLARARSRAASAPIPPPTQTAEPAPRLSFMVVDEKHLPDKGYRWSASNPNYERLYYAARPLRREEWYPDGSPVTHKANLVFTNRTARDLIWSGSIERHGMWTFVSEFLVGAAYRLPGEGPETEAKVMLWHSMPLARAYHAAGVRIDPDYEPSIPEWVRDSLDRVSNLAENPSKDVADVHPFFAAQLRRMFILGGAKAVRHITAQQYVDRVIAEAGGSPYNEKLETYLVADAFAARGDADAKRYVDDALAAPCGAQHPYAHVLFKALKKAPEALRLVNDGHWLNTLGDEGFTQALYLFARYGRESEVITLMTKRKAPVGESPQGHQNIRQEVADGLRWINKELLRDLLSNHLDIFPWDCGEYLAEGLRCNKATKALLQRGKEQAVVLIHGVPANDPSVWKAND